MKIIKFSGNWVINVSLRSEQNCKWK